VIALIDYRAGNLTSVRKALSALGSDFTTPLQPAELATADGIVVPGVGHFGATASIDDAWRSAIHAALERGTALLGICLGMQWLFEGSEEAPELPGLGVFRGQCVHLGRPPMPGSDADPAALKVPHVGWNSLELPRSTKLLRGIAHNAQVYFTHSYAAPVTADSAATTTHGVAFAAAVEVRRIAGVQFHPEKSGDVGLCILRNWLDTCAR
jgi:glutamine amidotransferase